MPGRSENPLPIQDEISFKELVLLLGIPAVTMKEKRKEKTTRNIVVAKRNTTKELNREFTRIRMAEEITTSAPEVDLTEVIRKEVSVIPGRRFLTMKKDT